MISLCGKRISVGDHPVVPVISVYCLSNYGQCSTQLAAVGMEREDRFVVLNDV